ncbi:hypothetical protein ABIE26_004844 [Pedobacter africanus]|uniref:Uncharacterized protein n=1 Tax=Pedobacter africanus TaxID=151894 RepID=A0ACC6L3X3_9SPHI|nr:hypothetical protein [Pedobacter africanus]MDR6786125.1 hypothetical protein [Pedobacter africanus]
MKKNLLIVLLILLSGTAFSQMNGNYNYSLAVYGFSQMQMPKILNQKNSDRFTNATFHGGMIKFNDNQINFRLGGTYLKKDVKLVNNCVGCQEANGEMKDYAFKVGFEKNMNFARIQPYVGFDIGFRFNKFDGSLVSTNDAMASPSALGPNGVETTKTGFTAAPLIGIKINPVPFISVFAESNLEMFYSYERQETVAADANNTRTFNKYNKAEFLLNPVTVGIQVHLGSNR